MREMIADIIADTREHIEKHGWWRGALVGPNGNQVCTLGGIYISQGWTSTDLHQQNQAQVKQFEDYLIEALESMHPKGLQPWQKSPKLAPVDPSDLGITDWNDHYAKNKQDVLDTLAKAEKIARGGFDPDKGIEVMMLKED